MEVEDKLLPKDKLNYTFEAGNTIFHVPYRYLNVWPRLDQGVVLSDKILHFSFVMPGGRATASSPHDWIGTYGSCTGLEKETVAQCYLVRSELDVLLPQNSTNFLRQSDKSVFVSPVEAMRNRYKDSPLYAEAFEDKAGNYQYYLGEIAGLQALAPLGKNRLQQLDIKLYMSRLGAEPETVIQCLGPENEVNLCEGDVLYRGDRVTFHIKFPTREIVNWQEISETMLNFTRTWRAN